MHLAARILVPTAWIGYQMKAYDIASNVVWMSYVIIATEGDVIIGGSWYIVQYAFAYWRLA